MRKYSQIYIHIWLYGYSPSCRFCDFWCCWGLGVVPVGHHFYTAILQKGACWDVQVTHHIIADTPQNRMDCIIVEIFYYEVYTPSPSWRDLLEILDYGRPNVSPTSSEAARSVWVIADRATWRQQHAISVVNSGLVGGKQSPQK